MSRRRTISTILIFAAIAVAGFILGRLVLLAFLGTWRRKWKFLVSMAHRPRNANRDQESKPARGCSEWKPLPVDVTAALAERKPDGLRSLSNKIHPKPRRMQARIQDSPLTPRISWWM